MIEMNYDETVTILSDIVEEFGPETVYQKKGEGRCVYTHNGQPDCLVGKFLARVGVPIERLEAADKPHGATTSADTLLEALEMEGVLRVDRLAHYLLAEVQYRQDGSEAWGDALRQAQRFVTGK